MFKKCGVFAFLFALFFTIDCFQIQPRIVNGSSSERGQFPFFAYLDLKLRFQPNTIFICGGSLLNHEFVLTAAHCVCNATKVAVHLGSLQQDEFEKGRHVFFARKKHFYIHPEYDDDSLWNDIALIKLSRPAVYSRLIQPISFPTVCEIPTGIDLTAIGNGITKTESDLAKTLQHTTLTTIPHSECSESFSFDVNAVFCVNGLKKNGICDGDSGGPLIHPIDHTLYGIASFANETYCEELPQGCTNVFHFYPWISEITGLQLPNCSSPSSFSKNLMNIFRNYVLRKPFLYTGN